MSSPASPNPDQPARWEESTADGSTDALRLLELAVAGRKACHNLNNILLALRCVCDGISMTSGGTTVRADDLLDQAVNEVRQLSTACRSATGPTAE